MSRATSLMKRSSECDPSRLEKAASAAVGVDVRDGVLLQIVAVRLDPFGRAEQRGLFAVPGGVDDRALRRPSLLAQFAERARFFEHRRHAADRIVRAVHPRVVMIAADHPFDPDRSIPGSAR